jgi:hypothetical protein
MASLSLSLAFISFFQNQYQHTETVLFLIYLSIGTHTTST